MANTTRHAAIVLTLTLKTLSGSPLAAGETANPRMVLYVENFVDFAPPTLSDAAHEVTRVFVNAGVHVDWVEGRPGANMVSNDQWHVTVLILNREMGERKIAAEDTPAGVLGQAALGTCRVFIFYHRIAALMNPLPGGGGEILGRIIAHEVGHLLLRGHSHSDHGIMRETLDLWPPVPPLFTQAQVATIRSELLITH